MNRAYCTSCQYPISTCVCQWVKPIDSPLEIIVLQHPLEVKHAKNTVKLLTLGLNNISVFEGENEDDFSDVLKTCMATPDQYVVCFPSEKSTSFEDDSPGTTKLLQRNGVKSIIFIDASWRKALKMWHLNPWLHQLHCWHFDSPPENQYKIRKSTQKNSLSTLEAVAYTLTTLCQVDCSELLSLFRARQRQFLNR